MQVKLIELRDKGTFIAAIAIAISGDDGYLARRAGYGSRCILFGRADGCGPFPYDPYSWGDRTFHTAHLWLEGHWDEVQDHDVVDVEFLLGETAAPKRSERETPISITTD